MRVRWSTPARLDFRRHTRYIVADSPAAARQISARVREAVKALATHPLMGRPGRVLDTRELVVPHTPFTIAYRVSSETVEIVGVLHQARQWPDRFDQGGEADDSDM